MSHKRISFSSLSRDAIIFVFLLFHNYLLHEIICSRFTSDKFLKERYNEKDINLPLPSTVLWKGSSSSSSSSPSHETEGPNHHTMAEDTSHSPFGTALDPDESSTPLTPAEKLELQDIVGVFLFYARAVDSTMYSGRSKGVPR